MTPLPILALCLLLASCTSQERLPRPGYVGLTPLLPTTYVWRNVPADPLNDPYMP